jgi:hypothetical protein
LIPNGIFASGFAMNISYTIKLYSGGEEEEEEEKRTHARTHTHIYIYKEVGTEAVEMRSPREIAVYKLIDEPWDI